MTNYVLNKKDLISMFIKRPTYESLEMTDE